MEHVAVLRAAIARIEGRGAQDLPQEHAAADAPAVPLGAPGFALDRTLGGGLRRGALHEIVPEAAHDEGAASGFAVALSARCLAAGAAMLLWIVEDAAGRESGLPYRPGLVSHGLDPDRLVMVRTRDAAATLWAAEEALRSRGLAVLVELWGGRAWGLAPSRRLVLAARAGGTVGLVLHAGLPGAAPLSSGSETRFLVAARPSPPGPSVGRRLPVPGPPGFAVRLDKVRAAACEIDPDQPVPLVWNPEQRCFHDPALPVAVAAEPADRPPVRLRRRRG